MTHSRCPGGLFGGTPRYAFSASCPGDCDVVLEEGEEGPDSLMHTENQFEDYSTFRKITCRS